ncbi:hypothetical protein [Mycobacterium paraense]|uniref:hypothetical protein n=1 Tax=Mycobacterium paraense TaxID=767916 RepID=UPI00115240B1|nr:hypothetical protein [Mycobacterium paraense]
MLLAASFIERNGTVLQIIAAIIIALATSAFAWLLGRRSRRIITLDYCIVSNVAIIPSEKRPQHLKMMIGDTEVANPFVTEVEFKNTGNKAIRKDDFLQPIEIYRPDSKIVDWNIVCESADGLVNDIGMSLRPLPPPEREFIRILPETLNRKDCFIVQIVYDGGSNAKPEISVRIEDEWREIREYQSSRRVATWFIVQAFIAAFSGLIAGVLLSAAIDSSSRPASILHHPMHLIRPIIVAALLSLVVIFATASAGRELRRRLKK